MRGVVTIADALEQVAGALRRAGLSEARREARLLVALAADVGAQIVVGYPERILEPATLARLDEWVERRCRREPISRISGHREFWSLPFVVTPDTLDPRPDSETLIEAALGLIRDRSAPLSVLDLGSGTGCLLLALLTELPHAHGIGVDVSPAAAAVGLRNAQALGLADRAVFTVGDWTAAIRGPFDLVVANPPYIATGEIGRLAPEVAAYDPPVALDGGPDGLTAYRTLAADLPGMVHAESLVLMEVGDGQAGAVARIIEAAGFASLPASHDLQGRKRCVIAKWGKEMSSEKKGLNARAS